MKNLLFLLTAFLTLKSSCSPSTDKSKAQAMLRQSCQYLWAQQSTDGGWHSQQHNRLRGGASLSAFLLYTLLQVPEWVYSPDEKQLNKALTFLRKQINEEGIVGCNDTTITDRPNLATAYTLLVLQQMGDTSDQPLTHKMTNYLQQQQFTEQRGFTPQQAAYGAWGFGTLHLPKGKSDYTDLNQTRLALMALANAENFDTLAQKALYFLRLAQKNPQEVRRHATGIPHRSIPYDGGFFESPITLSANKAGIETDLLGAPYYFRSYATATCEGLLGLLATGKTHSDPSVKDALRWLQDKENWRYPAGIPEHDPAQWREALFFYNLAIRSKAYCITEQDKNWKRHVISLLAKRQAGDGSFRNESGATSFEDDPLVATGWVVDALVSAL